MVSNLVISDEFLARCETARENIRRKLEAIEKEETPQVDGTGKKIIRAKGGYDYIIETYMRGQLDKHFPGWSWIGMPIVPMGAEWLLAQGHLQIIDENLLAFGIMPPIRQFHGVGAARIQYKTGAEHTPLNVVDIDKNIKGANSAALKYGINRLTRIGDDVYGKRLDYEHMGSYEDILETTGSATAFTEIIEKQRRMRWSEVFSILGVTSLGEITDFPAALEKIKEAKGY